MISSLPIKGRSNPFFRSFEADLFLGTVRRTLSRPVICRARGNVRHGRGWGNSSHLRVLLSAEQAKNKTSEKCFEYRKLVVGNFVVKKSAFFSLAIVITITTGRLPLGRSRDSYVIGPFLAVPVMRGRLWDPLGCRPVGK